MSARDHILLAAAAFAVALLLVGAAHALVRSVLADREIGMSSLVRR